MLRVWPTCVGAGDVNVVLVGFVTAGRNQLTLELVLQIDRLLVARRPGGSVTSNVVNTSSEDQYITINNKSQMLLEELQ